MHFIRKDDRRSAAQTCGTVNPTLRRSLAFTLFRRTSVTRLIQGSRAAQQKWRRTPHARLAPSRATLCPKSQSCGSWRHPEKNGLCPQRAIFPPRKACIWVAHLGALLKRTLPESAFSISKDYQPPPPPPPPPPPAPPLELLGGENVCVIDVSKLVSAPAKYAALNVLVPLYHSGDVS